MKRMALRNTKARQITRKYSVKRGGSKEAYVVKCNDRVTSCKRLVYVANREFIYRVFQ
jgi:hypothetical protein